MKLRKVQVLFAFGVLGVMSGGVGLAWACTAVVDLAVSTQSGGVGDTVEVTGRGSEGRVEVRWNAHDGPLLGRAAARDFTLLVTIPAVPKGIYTITAFERNADGTVGPRNEVAFEVIRSDVVAQDPDGGEPTRPPEQSPEGPGDPLPPPPAPSDPVIEPEPVTPAGPAEPADSPAAPAPRVAADPAPAVDRSPDPAPVTPQRRPAAPAPVAAPVPEPEPAPVAVDAGTTSAGTVSGDLWRGFDSGSGSLSGAEMFGTDTPTTDNTGMKAGVVLLVAGLVGLGLAGTGAAVARRRAVATGDSASGRDI